ncbi:tetratricopeptide (TPR) repeat protein [Actinoplanes campanulatus]|uniref:Tetratricopeptide (TPR) repeat protein n=1 Tax=Actinoplanes campanulatus TaxID=113559 RepID=A0A7W5FE59_9ACTN|nr:tetratricopeptide repeat protein [Actinoplanes campanulatus]MBB3095124.1 tetratricopeptide (TPR) repeat protein [Actinoplanes campanulatus]GGN23650.1 tetratricopeptide repeat protein [Actinoplanes campanulatus]GID34728.1 tetratricopeptide repeat protein [Actinoplanes campanulatus]
MPPRTPRAILVGRILVAAVVACLTALLFGAGLEIADQLASAIAVLVALITFAATYLFPPRPPAVPDPPTTADPAPALGPASAGEESTAAPASIAGPTVTAGSTDTAAPAATRLDAFAGPIAAVGSGVAGNDLSLAEPRCVGTIPPLASAFQPRTGLRERITAARGAGTDVVLGENDDTVRAARVLSGGGGVGKSQLAAWFAHQAIAERRTDLVVWVPASSPDQILTAYARAAERVKAPGVSGTDESADAAAFLEWLHTTDLTWLIVLDDITDPAHIADLWPPARPTGWTLATTRLQDATILSSGRQKIDIDVYSPAESITYLTDRLTRADLAVCLDDSVPELTGVLGHLPLALSHAAAYLINQALPCRTYLSLYRDSSHRLTELMPATSRPDDYTRPVATTLLLALEAADATEPAGLARPALILASLLDPAGHPEAFWMTEVVTDHLSSTTGTPVTGSRAREALRLLHRYSLVTHSPGDSARAVRIHALTARAARESADDVAAAARVAADALLEIWPENVHLVTDLTTSLRANSIALHEASDEALWFPKVNNLLHYAGTGLMEAGLYRSAIEHQEGIAAKAARLLGEQHLETIRARANLAVSYWENGRVLDAIALQEQVLSDRERILGDEHPDTIRARANLAASYQQDGRVEDAIVLKERVLADCHRILGDKHLETILARANLAFSYDKDGRIEEAMQLEEQVLSDRERILGDEHPDTILARANLATSYHVTGRTEEAVLLLERVLTERERVLGNQHPHTILARANLAISHYEDGRVEEAIALIKRAAEEFESVLGPEHPDTVAFSAVFSGWTAAG